MERACKNDRKIKILNGPETVKEGTSRGDTTTNLHNFLSRFFLILTPTPKNVNLEAPGPKTRQIPSQEAMGLFPKITKIMKNDPNWTHIRRIGLIVKDFES